MSKTQRKSGPESEAGTVLPAANATPLIVDVDGTLVRADISLESMVRIARTGLWALFTLVMVLLRGRAAAKTFAARRDPVDPARLPYRTEVLELVREAVAAGRPVLLASASHWRNVRRIARYLGLSQTPIATGRRANLKGAAKLDAIRRRIGDDASFDYIGDSRADLCLWSAARVGWTTGLVPGGIPVHRLGPPRPRLMRALAGSMRPHQWAKNALVLVPLLLSGLFFDPAMTIKAIAALLCMSVIASAIYLINDVADIDADRAHASKWKRPLAHGDLSIPAALAFAVVLAGGGLAGGWFAGGGDLLAWLLAYVVMSMAYTFRIKAVMVADAILLSLLYTIRIAIGGAAIGVAISYWLLLFSVFLFLSLAFLKRYIEIRDSADTHRLIKARGYVGGDLDLVMASGVSSGMVAVLVLALFAHEPEALANYAHPDLLLFSCLPLMYWLIRTWMMARRGEVEGDPVAFAMRDRRTLALFAMIGLIFLFALMGPDLAMAEH